MAEDKVSNVPANEVPIGEKNGASENEVNVELHQPDVESNAIVAAPLETKKTSRTFICTFFMVLIYIGMILLGGFFFRVLENDLETGIQFDYSKSVDYDELIQLKKEFSKKHSCISEDALVDFLTVKSENIIGGQNS